MANLHLTQDQLATFCRRWKVKELALFGSALRTEFTQASDIDLLVSFYDDAEWSLLDHIHMQQELEHLLDRKVDLVSRRAVERSYNWIRRDAILNTAQPIITAST